jgi:glycosyltransferase involved in cell wall biosynthesis
MSSPTVTIVIPCRNEAENIETCLMSILAQEPIDGGFEVIVADGLSNDSTRKIIERIASRDPRVFIIDNVGRIVSTGLNTAIRAARGKIIIRMDAHTQYAPDYVRRCVEVLSLSGADNVGGPWVARGSGVIGRAIAATFNSPFASGGSHGRDPKYEGRLDTVYLGCWRRDVFDRIGFFDEGLIRNQDDELNLRLSRVGGVIWQSPAIRSWYIPRESFRALILQFLQYGYWKVRVIQKHKLPASIRHLIPATFVFLLIMLSVLSVLFLTALKASVILIGAYLVFGLVASFRTAVRHGWDLLPLLPAVFACQHFGYGYGFLRGLVDFVILRRTPTRAYLQLSRGLYDSTK